MNPDLQKSHSIERIAPKKTIEKNQIAICLPVINQPLRDDQRSFVETRGAAGSVSKPARLLPQQALLQIFSGGLVADENREHGFAKRFAGDFSR